MVVTTSLFLIAQPVGARLVYSANADKKTAYTSSDIA
jgi:hypothetical protein